MSSNEGRCCSMYKVSQNNCTMVGNNEDSWGRDSQIWFEPKGPGKYGVVCVGYARKQLNPDGAMNEAGLCFDAFSMPHRTNVPKRDMKKSDFSYSNLKEIMQQFQTVEEVYTYLKQKNLQVLNGSPLFHGGMLLFVDKKGNYLVVEADKMSMGSDPTFVLANFSIAHTKNLKTIKMERYCKGVSFLQKYPYKTNLSYCEALSETMSVNRPKIGDGTLYTNIFDLNKGLVHLYFYRDFQNKITFDLKNELKKGHRVYDMASLFHTNSKYEVFLTYKTPQNNVLIKVFMIFLSVLSMFLGFWSLKGVRKNKWKYSMQKILRFIFYFVFSFYLWVLLRHENIFYFEAPYQDPFSKLVSGCAYFPVVFLIVLIPLSIYIFKLIRSQESSLFNKGLHITFGVSYLFALFGCAYWELYSVFQ